MSRILFCFAAWIGVGIGHVWSADFEVTTTNDSGAGSYRQAIEDSNDNPGPDRILFNIPGDGAHVIQPLTAWPAFREPIVVDGYSQPGTQINTLSNGINARLLIQLDGTYVRLTTAVRLSGGSSTLRGLSITGFGTAVWLDSSSNRVSGCFIGTDASGLNPMGNNEAFYMQRVGPGPPVFDATYLLTSCCHVIGGTDPAERNLISGNTGYTLHVGEYDNPLKPALPPVRDTTVLGNFIGTDLTGLARMPGGTGTMFTIRTATNFTIGGLEPGAGNIIALTDRTVHLYEHPYNTRILGNHFGVGVDGRTSIGRTNSTYTIAAGGHHTYLESNHIAFGYIGVGNVNPGTTLTRNLIFSNLLTGFYYGPRDYLEFTATSAGVTLELAGRMKALSNVVYRLEFFGNAAPHSSGYGEGEAYLGFTTFATGPTGEGSFQASLPMPEPFWPWVSFTATAPDGTTSGFFLTKPVRSSTYPQIYEQPAGFSARPGTNATLRIEASGAAPLLYQWRRNGVDIPTATNAVLALPNLQPGQDGTFTVFISNPLGEVLSEAAVVTVLVNPTFVRPPITQSVAPGEWLTLSAFVDPLATRPLSFGWRSNTTFVAFHGPGMENSSYLTVRVGTVDAVYTVTATNVALPSGVSAAARLAVIADRDHDGLPDAYETANGLDPDDPADADKDSDGDSVSNGQEYQARTNPQDAESFLRIERVSKGAGGTMLQLGAAATRTYSVQYRARLDGAPWLTLTNLPALPTSQTIVVMDATPFEQRFYRLSIP